jgi:hypothetical protein
MIRRAVSISAALGAAAMLAFAGSAVARSGAPTTVTIKKESDGFFGFVDSTKPNKCANNREVSVYKEKGDSPDPSSDKKIGSDTAQPNGDGYMWSTGNTGNQKGDFYAFAHRIPGCKKGISKVVTRH